jgi:cell division protein DivIC
MKKKPKKGSQIIDLAEARDQRRLKREAEALKKINKLKRKEKPEKSDRQVSKSFRRRYLVALAAILVFFVMGFSMFNIVNLKMQEADALALKQKLLDDKKRLQTELSLVHSPAYIEQQARIQLKMVKPGEILYIFPKTEKKEVQETDKSE